MTHSTSNTIFRIPASHHHCHLRNYTAPALLRQYVEEFIAGQYTHLLLTGNPGTGKTHLSVALYRWAVSIWGTMQAFWCDFPQFVMDVKHAYNHHTDLMQEVAEAARFVALDDVFGRQLTPYEFESILYPSIQLAHRNQARFIITTNLSLEQIAERLATHELDRVLDRCRHYQFDTESLRG